MIAKKLTYKSKIIPLSDLFVTVFLKSDGMFQPENVPIDSLT